MAGGTIDFIQLVPWFFILFYKEYIFSPSLEYSTNNPSELDNMQKDVHEHEKDDADVSQSHENENDKEDEESEEECEEDDALDDDIRNKIEELRKGPQTEQSQKQISELENLLNGELTRRDPEESKPPIPIYNPDTQKWEISKPPVPIYNPETDKWESPPVKKESPMDYVVEKMETEMPNYTEPGDE